MYLSGLITDRGDRYCCQNSISEIKTKNNPVKIITACPLGGFQDELHLSQIYWCFRKFSGPTLSTSVQSSSRGDYVMLNFLICPVWVLLYSCMSKKERKSSIGQYEVDERERCWLTLVGGLIKSLLSNSVKTSQLRTVLATLKFCKRIFSMPRHPVWWSWKVKLVLFLLNLSGISFMGGQLQSYKKNSRIIVKN